MNPHQLGLISADVISAIAIVGTFAGLLPPMAALAAVIWYTVQIWESDTVQTFVRGRRHVLRRKRLRKHNASTKSN